jgi:hypothetical protein
MITILITLGIVLAQDEFELSSFSSGGKVSHKLYQSYDGVLWEERGVLQITTHGDKRRKPLISIKNSKFEKEKLKVNGIYHIGAYSEGDTGCMVQSSIPTCYLLGSDLQDIISVLTDSESGNIVAINYKPDSKICEKTTTALKIQTMVEAISTREAPKPYFIPPKVEELQEQQSFFRKYVRVI